MFEWFWRIFQVFGLFRKNHKILFLGLDNAGKTTYLAMLKHQKLKACAPTQYVTAEQVEIRGVNVKAFDLGGHEIARRVWRDYFFESNGVIFLIDSASSERLEEARVELYALLRCPELSSTPIAVVFNKIDLPNATDSSILYNFLGLETQGLRPLRTFSTSVVKKIGLHEPFVWFAEMNS